MLAPDLESGGTATQTALCKLVHVHRHDHHTAKCKLPRQDSNLESSAPEADALSIRPRETIEDVSEDYGWKLFSNLYDLFYR